MLFFGVCGGHSSDRCLALSMNALVSSLYLSLTAASEDLSRGILFHTPMLFSIVSPLVGSDGCCTVVHGPPHRLTDENDVASLTWPLRTLFCPLLLLLVLCVLMHFGSHIIQHHLNQISLTQLRITTDATFPTHLP